MPHSSTRAGVFTADNSAYFVTQAGDDYSVIKRSGAANLNPIALEGEIQGFSFDPARHFLVITSSFQNMTLLSMNELGDITGSFVAKGVAEAGKAIGSSTMLGDGRLAMIVGDTNIYVIDLAASIAQQTLVKSVFAIDAATSMGWMSQIPGLANAILVLDGSRVLIVDANTGQITDQKSLLDTQVVGRFREYHPHIVSQNAGQQAQNGLEVTFAGANGKLMTRSLRGASAELGETWLDISQMTFTAMFVPGIQINMNDEQDKNTPKDYVEVYRFDLTQAGNQLPFDRSEVEVDVRTVVMPSFLFLQHRSVLGKAERRTYGEAPERKFVEAYNFDVLRSNFRR